MGEEQAVLIEKPEDLIKAAEWGRKQQEKCEMKKRNVLRMRPWRKLHL